MGSKYSFDNVDFGTDDGLSAPLLGSAKIAPNAVVNQPHSSIVDLHVKTDPERNQKNLSISEDTGIPTDVVERNFDDASNKQKSAKVQRAMSSRESINAFFSDPENMKIAHDDVENLATLDRISKEFNRGRARNISI